MAIKIIDTLTPAGEFDVVAASNVGYSDPDGSPAKGSLEEAVYGLRQAVGLTEGSQESIADKLGTAAKPESAPEAGDAVEATGLYKAVSDAETRITTAVTGVDNKIGTPAEGETLVKLLETILGQVDEKTTTDLSNALGFTGDSGDTAKQTLINKLGLTGDNAEATVASLIDAAVEALRATYGTAAKPESSLGAGDGEEATGLYKAVSNTKTEINNALGFTGSGDDNAKKAMETVVSNLVTKLGLTDSNSNATVASLITEAANALRGTDDSKNTLTSIETSIQSLREHINTINPPTLTVQSSFGPYLASAGTKTISIPITFNRYLENLELYAKITTDNNDTYTKLNIPQKSLSTSYTWSTSANGKIGSKTMSIVYVSNPDNETAAQGSLPEGAFIIKSYPVSCKFSWVVYWFQSETKYTTIQDMLNDELNLNTIGASHTTEETLTYGHPSQISFNGSGYIYYLYPATNSSVFGNPKFFVGGQDQSGGFTQLAGTVIINGGALGLAGGELFNVYRSNQPQTSSLKIDIK